MKLKQLYLYSIMHIYRLESRPLKTTEILEKNTPMISTGNCLINDHLFIAE